MQAYQRDFIRFAIERGVLRFGEFTLKSGRTSPYFFNAGLFDSGLALARLGRFYAEAVIDSGIDFDVLFGPAYKVTTAGTAIREVMQIIDAQGARAAGVLIALNRQERGKGELSAIQEVERDFGMPVVSIVSLEQVLEYLAEDAELKKHLPAVEAYRAQYGI